MLDMLIVMRAAVAMHYAKELQEASVVALKGKECIIAEVVEEKELYAQLREFLEALPGGFPATESGVEMKTLKMLSTPADAAMALCLTPKPEPVEAIAERCGLEVLEAEERLESMYDRGLIFKTREDGRNLYRAEQYVVGIYEYQLGTLDKEFAALMEEYFPYLGMQMIANKTKQMRVIPVDSAVEESPRLPVTNGPGN